MSALESVVADQLQGMGFELEALGRHDSSGADLRVVWPDHGQRFLVDVKKRAPRTPYAKRVERAGDGDRARWILALPHVTRHEGEDLRRRGVQYIDSGGNAWIEGRGLTLWVEGRRPLFEARAGLERPSRAFRPAGLRVLFVLLSAPDLLSAPQREIAVAAGVSLGAVSNTLADLRATGMLGRSRRTHVITAQQDLERTWIEHYASTLRSSLEERRVDGPGPRWWTTTEAADDVRWAGLQFGGESALERLDAGLRAEETVLYGTPPWQDIVRRVRMPVSAQGRVVLRERFWDPERLGGDLTVPPLLIRADAMASGDERQIEIAERLVERHHEPQQSL